MTMLYGLGSGSRGNCFAVESDGVVLLIDAGFSAKEIERRAKTVGLSLAARRNRVDAQHGTTPVAPHAWPNDSACPFSLHRAPGPDCGTACNVHIGRSAWVVGWSWAPSVSRPAQRATTR